MNKAIHLLTRLTILIFSFLLVVNTTSLSAQQVYVEDTLLKVDGKPIYLNGANTPWNSWNDLGRSFSYSWWDNHFAELQLAGINSTRVWLSCDPNHDALDMDENGILQGVSDAFWTDMDSLMSIAKKYQIYIMGALISFDHFKASYETSGYWSEMLRNEAKVDTFVERYAVPLVERYKDNPYFFSVDACNEILWVSNEENTSENAVDWENIQYYVGKVAQRVHETSDVLVCVSNYIKYVSPDYQGNKYSDANLQLQVGDDDAYLDFYKIHYYTWVSPHFDGFHPTHTPEHYSISDKPAITGEMPANEIYAWDESTGEDAYLMDVTEAYEISYQNGWQGTMAWTSNGVDEYGNLENNLAEATTTFRENHYDLVYPTVFDSFLYVSDTVLKLSFRENSSATFKIFANVPWSLSTNDDWIDLSSISGTVSSAIQTVSKSENTTEEERIGVIYISSYDELVDSIKVIQKIKSKEFVIEAEDYSAMSGMQTQATSDEGGGLNTSHAEPGDWLEYIIDFAYSGVYNVEFRHAGWECNLDAMVEGETQTSFDFPETEGWQSWETDTAGELSFNEGLQTLRLEFNCTGINFNWIKFTWLRELDPPDNTQVYLVHKRDGYQIYPNPAANQFTVVSNYDRILEVKLISVDGKLVSVNNTDYSKTATIDISEYAAGLYYVIIQGEKGIVNRTLLKN